MYSESMKKRLPNATRACFVVCALLVAAGCKEETTRPTRSDQAQSRIRAVEQAEMQRAAQQKQGAQDQPPPSAAPPAGGAAAASGGQAPAAQPQATPGEVAPQPYLPPSEHGAYVEITETPAGSPPPAPARSSTAATPGAAGAPPGSPPVGGGTGGNMPAAVAPNPPVGAAGSPPPAPGTSGLQLGGAAPSVQGPSALNAPATGGPAAAANAELERKLREFDALMKRAQAAAERERALGGGTETGITHGRGGAPDEIGGAGGAAARATGSGASPDLSGEADLAGLRRGPSALRARITEDDDIVARQLREAAERETDPVLQEKLWDEYRKYKAP